MSFVTVTDIVTSIEVHTYGCDIVTDTITSIDVHHFQNPLM